MTPARLLPALVHAALVMGMVGVAGDARAVESTPREMLDAFRARVAAGELMDAATRLEEPARTEGEPRVPLTELAAELGALMDEDPGVLQNVPAAAAATPLRVGTLHARGMTVALELVAVDHAGLVGWRVSPRTTRAVQDGLMRRPVTWPARLLPAPVRDVSVLGALAWQWLDLAVMIALALLLSVPIIRVLFGVLARVARGTENTWDDRLAGMLATPTRLFLVLTLLSALTGRLRLPAFLAEIVGELLSTGLVLALTWGALRAIGVAAAVLEDRSVAGMAADDPRARAVRTQIRIMGRVVEAVVWLVGGALVLTQFEVMRQVGTSLLASAGVAGVVLGFAAQRSIAMLLAGVQLSITQPIRIGDKVILEGDFTTIEEIKLTYAVARAWDGRRLVVPITHFLDKPFQNWTLGSSELLGTVLFHADYAVPVQAVREELQRFVATRPEWDRRACSLIVVDTTDRVVQLRALVSAADADRAWELRCAVREHLLTYLQQLEGGRYLPRIRSASVT